MIERVQWGTGTSSNFTAEHLTRLMRSDAPLVRYFCSNCGALSRYAQPGRALRLFLCCAQVGPQRRGTERRGSFIFDGC
jgi:hypothetical protein